MHDLRNNFIDLLAHRFSLPGGSNQNIPHQAHSMGKTVFHELHLPDGGSSLAHQFQDIIGEALYTGLHSILCGTELPEAACSPEFFHPQADAYRPL